MQTPTETLFTGIKSSSCCAHLAMSAETLSPSAGSVRYASDGAAVDMQKYRQLHIAASSAVSLAPSATGAAGGAPPAVAPAKPPAGIVAPNIHQPPPALPPFPPPVQVCAAIC